MSLLLLALITSGISALDGPGSWDITTFMLAKAGLIVLAAFLAGLMGFLRK
jgi:hypothetical protein